MGVDGELMRLEEPIELAEVTAVEGDGGARPEDALVSMEALAAGRKRPEKARQRVDVAAVLEHLADAGDLLVGEAERRRRSRRRDWLQGADRAAIAAAASASAAAAAAAGGTGRPGG